MRAKNAAGQAGCLGDLRIEDAMLRKILRVNRGNAAEIGRSARPDAALPRAMLRCKNLLEAARAII